MKRVWSYYDFKIYTYMRRVLSDLALETTDYIWLITDIDAYPTKEKYSSLLDKNNYLLLSTSEFVEMLDDDDFQWVFAVFSAIPSSYLREDILAFNLPYIQSFCTGQYNPYEDIPKLQHPYAELEILVSESGMALVTDKEELIDRFKCSYPLYTDYFSIGYHSLKCYMAEYCEIAESIYVCNILNCDKGQMAKSEITLVKNLFGKYVVTDWMDYEYGQFSESRSFTDPDLAAQYAWRLFVNRQKRN